MPIWLVAPFIFLSGSFYSNYVSINLHKIPSKYLLTLELEFINKTYGLTVSKIQTE